MTGTRNVNANPPFAPTTGVVGVSANGGVAPPQVRTTAVPGVRPFPVTATEVPAAALAVDQTTHGSALNVALAAAPVVVAPIVEAHAPPAGTSTTVVRPPVASVVAGDPTAESGCPFQVSWIG